MSWRLGVGALLVLAWPVVLSRFGRGDVYVAIGSFAVLVIAIVLAVTRGAGLADGPPPRERGRLGRDVALGIGVGVAMTVATYAAYAAALVVLPRLAGDVAGLYGAAHPGGLGGALLATVAAIVAEEVLWRGPLLAALGRARGMRVAAAVSLVTYALAQSGSGSLIVIGAALVCGAIWLGERLATRSMVAPLLSHAIWTLVVIHLLPVTRVVPG